LYTFVYFNRKLKTPKGRKANKVESRQEEPERLDLIYQEDVLTEHKLASNTIKASQIKSNKTRGMQGENTK